MTSIKNSLRPSFPSTSIPIPEGVDYASQTQAQVCDWNLKIEQSGDCDNGSINDVYMVVNWLTTTYQETRESIDDGFGMAHNVMKRIDPIYRFETFCTDNVLDVFYRLSMSTNEWTLSNNDPLPDSIDIIDLQISHTEVAPKVFRVTAEFRSLESGEEPFGLTGCCRQLYQEAPYEDPCTGFPSDPEDPEDPEDPVDCSAFNVLVNRVGNDLEANVTGAPGSFSVIWQYRETTNDPWQTIIVGASSIGLQQPGIYRAVASTAGCPNQTDQYLYVGECFGFGVTINQVENTLVATPAGDCSNNAVFEFYLFNQGTLEWDAQSHDDSPVFVPSEDGLYKVVYTCENCEAMNVSTFVEDLDCPNAELSISREGDVLTANNVLSDPTYEWYLDTGSGFVLINGETGQNLTATENGLYQVVVIITGCEYTEQFLVLDPPICDPCEFVEASINSESEPFIELEVSGCVGDAEITWFLNEGNGFIQYDSGATIEVDDPGLYLAKLVCGDCEKQLYYLNCDGESNGDTGEGEVKVHEEFKDDNSEVIIPDSDFEILLVFKDNLHMREGASLAGYTVTANGVQMSEILTNNPNGGEFVKVLYKVLPD